MSNVAIDHVSFKAGSSKELEEPLALPQNVAQARRLLLDIMDFAQVAQMALESVQVGGRAPDLSSCNEVLRRVTYRASVVEEWLGSERIAVAPPQPAIPWRASRSEQLAHFANEVERVAGECDVLHWRARSGLDSERERRLFEERIEKACEQMRCIVASMRIEAEDASSEGPNDKAAE